jgi:cation diffusion facilitator CzcD-associated flavoprotein CzcO
MDREPHRTEHVDVLIVGAGISGIGAAYYLQRAHPGRSYAILEARGATGGTWDLFRYPGIRSDSDLSTFGYAFKPWNSEKVIAGGDAILAYVRETAAENGIDRKIRLQHKVIAAAWSTATARWTVTVERTDTGARQEITCGWLFCASGYYRYDKGFTPRFEGSEQFRGRIVHPQHWPDDLDYTGQRVVVIGSGATAVTLVPAMAAKAGHVTMLQRTPSYVLSIPSEDAIANLLRRFLPREQVHALTRRKNIALQGALWRFCQRYPRAARRALRYLNAKALPEGYPVDEHFNPPYDPWDQRMCMVADGDLFEEIRRGRASVVTDRIATFTERGVRLVSGRELDADLIVTATGLELLVFGGIALTVDGAPVNLPEKVAFKGMMLDGVPNFSFSVGYTNASWTLKVDLLCDHFCRLLGFMDANGHAICCPERKDTAAPTRPLLDFAAGYIQRVIDTLPRQGAESPWLMSMDYELDTRLFAVVEDEHLRFSRRPATGRQPSVVAAGTTSGPASEPLS